VADQFLRGLAAADVTMASAASCLFSSAVVHVTLDWFFEAARQASNTKEA